MFGVKLFQNIVHFLRKAHSRLRMLLPLRARAYVLLIASVSAIYYFGVESSDLIAGILGCSTLILLLLALLCFLIGLYSTRSYLHDISVAFQSPPPSRLHSGGTSLVPFRIHRLSQTPLTRITVRRVFRESNVKTQAHALIGNKDPRDSRSAYVMDPVSFPRRGIFEQTHVAVQVTDALGCFSQTYLTLSELNFEVYPQRVTLAPLPIVAASSVLGEVEQSQLDRTGDLFDIKPYQSGDSLKRVIWKAYARSGELFVRHPEPAVAPEGNVSIFVLAHPQDDDVAASALAYLRMLDTQHVEYSVGFLGASEKLCHSVQEAEHACLEAASNLVSRPVVIDTEFSTYLSELDSLKGSSRTVIVFSSERAAQGNRNTVSTLKKTSAGTLSTGFSRPSSEKLALGSVLQTAHQSGHQLIFALTPAALLPQMKVSRTLRKTPLAKLLERVSHRAGAQGSVRSANATHGETRNSVSLHPHETHYIEYRQE